MAGHWIDQAACLLVLEDVVEAGLVARDARIDLVFALFGRLLYPVGVRQEGAGHADHVGVAFG